jgi:hypothetical protein
VKKKGEGVFCKRPGRRGGRNAKRLGFRCGARVGLGGLGRLTTGWAKRAWPGGRTSPHPFFLFKKLFSVLFFWLVLKSFKNSFGTTKLLEKYGFTFGMKRR